MARDLGVRMTPRHANPPEGHPDHCELCRKRGAIARLAQLEADQLERAEQRGREDEAQTRELGA